MGMSYSRTLTVDLFVLFLPQGVWGAVVIVHSPTELDQVTGPKM